MQFGGITIHPSIYLTVDVWTLRPWPWWVRLIGWRWLRRWWRRRPRSWVLQTKPSPHFIKIPADAAIGHAGGFYAHPATIERLRERLPSLQPTTNPSNLWP